MKESGKNVVEGPRKVLEFFVRKRMGTLVLMAVFWVIMTHVFMGQMSLGSANQWCQSTIMLHTLCDVVSFSSSYL